ncbi:MAG TPA: hypothetical protein VHB27_23370 [Rhodopila sp.]|uniref:hypothetical protein n=1 Tax=Rhodopila sp. TaxID=2480087 RepID=UPI002C5E308C|nr:hypothetical protein [Rhodopila sp.]HVY18179.1 hypothetical protein [Rhodopila sp.]
MRLLILCLVLSGVTPAFAQENAVLPRVAFSATAVQQTGPMLVRQHIHYADGRLRIDGANGFVTTILDLHTGTECLLMANHTYLVLPMDNELFRQFFAPPMAATGADLGRQPMAGVETTKYHFEGEGALDAGGFYWLTNTGIMVRRDYEDGVYGESRRHLDYLSDLSVGPQDSRLFQIPAGYRLAR